MALAPEDIKNKQFTTTRGFGEGYVETEVDDFLDEVYEEFSRLVGALTDAPAPGGDGNGLPAGTSQPARSAEAAGSTQPGATATPVQPAVSGQQPRATGADPTPGGAVAQTPIEAATGILALAQRTAEDHIAVAQAEADQILGDAHRQADELAREVEEQRRHRLGSLESERSQLERRIESLRTFEQEYRSRLRAYLDAQLHELDAALSPEPDGARRFLLDGGSTA